MSEEGCERGKGARTFRDQEESGEACQGVRCREMVVKSEVKDGLIGIYVSFFLQSPEAPELNVQQKLEESGRVVSSIRVIVR